METFQIQAKDLLSNFCNYLNFYDLLNYAVELYVRA